MLNNLQCRVLWRMMGLFLFSLLFPPYSLNGYHGYSVGYAPFFLAPRLPDPIGYGLPPGLAAIDGQVELCEWLAILVVTAVALVTLADGRKTSAREEKSV